MRKIVRDSALVTSVGSEFHVWGAATLKARDARVSLVREIQAIASMSSLELKFVLSKYTFIVKLIVQSLTILKAMQKH